MTQSAPDYEESYHRSKHDRLIESELYYDLRARHAQTDLFADMDPKSAVFEFGVGLGKNIALLPNKAGYDISKFAREFSEQKGIEVFADMAQVPEGHFDVVLSSHVLEHLEEPIANLQLLGSKLKPGGKLVIVLPVEHHDAQIGTDTDHHLFAWNFRTITNLLERANYRVIDRRFRYGTAQYKLRLLGKLSFRLYDATTRLLGRVLNRRDMVIVAEKLQE